MSHSKSRVQCRERNRRRTPRRGIVLLIVLGMLSLFTVLIISFVVFSSQAAQSSAASQERRLDEILPQPPIKAAALQLIAGTDDHRSAAYGASLLEDFYGVDGVFLRVGHKRPIAAPPYQATAAGPSGGTPGGQLLLPLNGSVPQTTLFKFPTSLTLWNEDGDAGQADGQQRTATTTPNAVTYYNNLRTSLRAHLDDVIAGRIVTFDEGPLKHKSFRVVRYFGVQNGTDDGGASVSNNPEYSLAGNVVIDLDELGTETISIGGVPYRLYDIAANFPNALLYDVGPDGQPGRAGFDDNGTNGADDLSELGTINSDDVGYRFVLNGGVFNGRGINPSGLTGVNRGTTSLDAFGNIEFTLNPRLTGAAYQGGSTTPEFDEAWDAADWENIFLAWQPSDHRRPILTSDNQIYGGVNGAELNRQLGQNIIPSFHRPAVINYLMNAPIRIPGDYPPNDPNYDPQYDERTFANIRANFQAGGRYNDGLRLQALVTRLRRATLRPLNFPHEYVDVASSDLDGDGIPFDGTPLFSGSNSVPILNQTINLAASPAVIISQIEELAAWLINGPWDVDNDGDGLPDSVWVDFNLPAVTGPDGKLLKPLVAPLIEDLDGKINVNYAGNYNQLTNQRYDTSTVAAALRSFGFGGGIGPAEIDFSHLFSADAPATGFVGPVATTQTAVSRPLDRILQTRYGNLMNVRYGGSVFNYAGSYPYPFTGAGAPAYTIPPSGPIASYPQYIYPYTLGSITPPTYAGLPAGATLSRFLHYPGVGTRLQPQETQDSLARIPFPSRSIDHAVNAFAGRPVDLSGTERTYKSTDGRERFDTPYRAADLVNHPYEFGATEIRGDDRPFTPAEYVDLLAGGPLGGRLAQLLGDAAQANEALTRLITVESRAVDSPELPGAVSIVDLFAQIVDRHPAANPAPRDQSTLLNRMLAVEFRKGAKLNLNRQLGNVRDDDTDGFGDEYDEVRPIVSGLPAATNPRANYQVSSERAFPALGSSFSAAQRNTRANYGPTGMYASNGVPAPQIPDFDGVDRDGDGRMFTAGEGTDLDGDGEAEAMASGSELLARHLYCLMYALISGGMETDSMATNFGELVPNYPYPGQLRNASVAVKNNYVARQLAQWAVNAVDYRDTDAKFTRLRYDPDPFDNDGFDLTRAIQNEVWGMERPELQITETFAMHDKRLKRNLAKQPNAGDPTLSLDGEKPYDDDTMGPEASDSDMDQFRIPQGTAIVELQALAPRVEAGNGSGTVGENQPSLPRELYDNNNLLDLARVAGSGNLASPVWRLAVGQYHNGDALKSTRWLFDADRLVDLANAGGGNEDIADYLTNGPGGNIVWNGAMPNVDAERTTWEESWRYGADIRPSRRLEPAPPATPGDPIGREYVTLADNDFDAANDRGSNPSRIRLERFVLFTEGAPNPAFNVFSNNASGMRPNNVYFNKPDANAPVDPAMAAPPRLAPGQYAVVAPRVLTHFGQKTTSQRFAPPSSPPGVNAFLYDPSEQRFEITQQTTAGWFRFNYYRNGNPNPQTPDYEMDDAADHDVNRVLPIICQSLYPSEVPGYTAGPGFDWSEYTNTTNVPVGQRVDMGFNISEPLPGDNYYPAPEYLIQDGTNGGAYPLRDGYRDYVNLAGFHPDTPLDHLPTSPLDQNGWAGVGTYQEAATVFLQRLADPTRPWHAKDNPYITVDFMPMDLTTINGESDVRETVVRLDNAGATVTELVDDRTTWASPPVAGATADRDDNGFDPVVRFDSRRKIPDLTKDRGLSMLIGGTREVIAHRSKLSMTTSVLRDTVPDRATPPAAAVPGQDHWPFSLGAMWNSGTENSSIPANITRYANPVPTGQPASVPSAPGQLSSNLRLDTRALNFRQSIGFVNREYGLPISNNSSRAGILGTGEADYVLKLGVSWMNREYRSPYDLMNVPSVSRTRLLATFNPLSILEDGSNRELPTNVWESIESLRGGNADFTLQDSHLLPFDSGIGARRNADYQGQFGGRQRLGLVENGPNLTSSNANVIQNNFDAFTGDRPGLEQIFDFVDVGPVWFDSRRWFDPGTVQFRPDLPNTQPASEVRRIAMFNRAVETLQPPNNYIGLNRTPGKINLNTTPDYIRKGPGFPTVPNSQNELLDGQIVPQALPNPTLRYLEDPSDPSVIQNTTLPATISSNPQNNSLRGDGFTNEFTSSRLFGNGSVYRSMAWAMSTPYDLDQNFGSPVTHGQVSEYGSNTDSQFGFEFKGFIESRRGYSTTVPGPLFPMTGATAANPYRGRNPRLDFRYPTRFAGVFAPAQASATPSLQRFMRTLDRSSSQQPASAPSNQPMGVPRKTYDMSLLRPHPDFDVRGLGTTDQTAISNANDTSFSLQVETPQPAPASPPEVSNLRMPLLNKGLFERSQADLHMSDRQLDRDSFFRYQNAARMAGVSTHHSNVFMMRLTLGYFEVDPETGAVGAEFISDTGTPQRSRATYVIDRTVPVGFLRGKVMNTEETILYSEILE